MSDRERIQRALDVINGGVPDGDHHKMWVIDQMVRALTGCPMVERTARDYRGEPYTYVTQGESEEYLAFVRAYETEDVGDWEKGIAP